MFSIFKNKNTSQDEVLEHKKEYFTDLSSMPTFKAMDIVALSCILSFYYKDKYNQLSPLVRMDLVNVIKSLKNRLEYVSSQHGEFSDVDVYTFHFEKTGADLIKNISSDVERHILEIFIKENPSFTKDDLIKSYKNVEKELCEIF